MKREDRANLLQFRASLYGFLSLVFGREPEATLVRKIAEGEFFAEVPSLSPRGCRQGEEDFIKGVETLKVLFSRIREGSDVAGENLIAEIQEDFRRLFVDPYRLKVPPWESVYRSGKRQVFQEAALEVRRAYLAAGYTFEGMGNVPDDHIALELGFMSALCQAALAEQTEEGKRANLSHQVDFLRKHLLSWVPTFCDELKASASTDFFRGLSSLLAGFVQMDVSLLEEIFLVK